MNEGHGIIDDALFEIVLGFFLDIGNKQYDMDANDINMGEEKYNYNKYIKLIKKIKPKEYYQFDFQNISTKEIYDCMYEILIILYGSQNSNKLMNDLEEFSNLIVCSNSKNIFDGMNGTLYDIKTGEVYNKFVQLPGFDNVSNIVCAIHEFIHFIIEKYEIDETKKYYYQEILSIYAEKIASDYLENNLNFKDVIRKCEQTRLECIKWHSYDGKRDIKIYEFMLKFNKKMALQEYNGIKCKDFVGMYKMRAEQLEKSYSLGYLYAESLFQKYLEDTKNNKFKDLLEGNINLQSLLDYYEINASNEIVFDNAFSKIKKVK